jgi:hypothetical protein
MCWCHILSDYKANSDVEKRGHLQSYILHETNFDENNLEDQTILI